jgi:hypothetical protein
VGTAHCRIADIFKGGKVDAGSVKAGTEERYSHVEI